MRGRRALVGLLGCTISSVLAVRLCRIIHFLKCSINLLSAENTIPSIHLNVKHFELLSLSFLPLILIAPITTAADDIHKYFFHSFSEKIRLDVSSVSSATQRIHMKNQALFTSKEKK